MGKFSKKMYGKVVGKDNDDRPGWKGPGYVKKPEPKSKAVVAEDTEAELVAEPLIPVELQQLLLNIVKDAFPEILASESLQPTLQEVKGALYERDFHRAFGKQEYLEAYSVRWSCSRALCYQSILVDISEHLLDVLPFRGATEAGSDSAQVACFGGGSAEIVAFAGYLKYSEDFNSQGTIKRDKDVSTSLEGLAISNKETANIPRPKLKTVLIDSANWQDAVDKLCHSLITPPILSKYASTAAKAANTKTLLKTGDFAADYLFSQDILKMSQEQLNLHVGKQKMLMTLLFTLNELYTASIAGTTAFLLKLTMATKPGSILLVVDSPGSYSEAMIGSESKKYPTKWLLDHFLLTRTGEKTEWEKIVSDDSKWFRIPEKLRYPIPLENMRYQIHLYRRL